jgi:hypothetical protein
MIEIKNLLFQPLTFHLAGDCGPVYGELLTFDDPSTRLPAIDRQAFKLGKPTFPYFAADQNGIGG